MTAISGVTTPAIHCPVCGMAFFSQSTLRGHRAVHRGETTCPVCYKMFMSKGAMKKHVQNIHRSGAESNVQAKSSIWKRKLKLLKSCLLTSKRFLSCLIRTYCAFSRPRLRFCSWENFFPILCFFKISLLYDRYYSSSVECYKLESRYWCETKRSSNWRSMSKWTIKCSING